MKRVLSAFLVLFLILAHSTLSLSCQDIPDTPPNIYDNDIVFLGEVQSIRENWWSPHPTNPDYNAGILVKYKVLKPYHGLSYSQEFIEINVGDDRDQGLFERGEVGLVVANFWNEQKVFQMDASKIHWSSCSGEGYYQNKDVIREVEEKYQKFQSQKNKARYIGFIFISLFSIMLFLYVKRKPQNSQTT